MPQIAGRVGFRGKGAYDPNATYTMLNVVTWTDGNAYFALDTTTGNPPSDTNHWQPLTEMVKATLQNLGVVKPDGTSITIDSNGVISASVSAGVASFNGRTGAVSPANADYAADQVSFDSTYLPISAATVQAAIATLCSKVGCKPVTGFPITGGQSTHTSYYVGMGITAASVPIHIHVANPAAISSPDITVEAGAGGLITVTATATASTTMDIIFVDRYYDT